MKKRLNKFSHYFHEFGFRRKMIILLTILAIGLTLYTSFLSYMFATNIIYKMSVHLSESSTTSTYTILQNYFQSIQSILTQIVRRPELRSIIGNQNLSEADIKLTQQDLDNALDDVLAIAINNNISFEFIHIYCQNGFSYHYGSNYDFAFDNFSSCEQHYKKQGLISDSYSPAVWGDFIHINDNMGLKTPVVLNIRSIYDSVSLERVGIVLAAVQESSIYSTYSVYNKDAFLLSHNGVLFSGNNKENLGETLGDNLLLEKILNSDRNVDTFSHNGDNKTVLVSFHKPYTDFIYLVVPFNQYSGIKSNEIISYLKYSVLIAVTAIFFGFIIAIFISRGMASSVESLKKTVLQVNKGDLDARYLPVRKNKDEISYLGENFNGMLDRIQELFQKQKQDSLIQKDLELKLLQSQINPHLLYNTLDSTLWAIKSGKGAEAETIVIALSQFFKISLSRGSDLIPLRDELSLIRAYLDIQRIARKKEIQLKCKIDDALLDYQVIKLSIQPLVENAIIHGFSGYRDNGQIEIFTRVDKEMLLIHIKDNGIGLMDDEVEQINQHLSFYPPQKDMKHFGLYNINRRIKNAFGNQYGIMIDSELGNYTEVIMTIPCIK